MANKHRKRNDGPSLTKKIGFFLACCVLGLLLQRGSVWQGLHSTESSELASGGTIGEDAQSLRRQVRQIIDEEFFTAKQELDRAIKDVRAEGHKLAAESVAHAQKALSSSPAQVATPVAQVAAVPVLAALAQAAAALVVTAAPVGTAAPATTAAAAVDVSTQLDPTTAAKVKKIQEERMERIKLLDAPCKLSAAMAEENKADEHWWVVGGGWWWWVVGGGGGWWVVVVGGALLVLSVVSLDPSWPSLPTLSVQVQVFTVLPRGGSAEDMGHVKRPRPGYMGRKGMRRGRITRQEAELCG
jgi:hypothetical protein